MGFFKKKLDLDNTEIDYDIDYASLEAKANRFTVVCLIITYFIMGVMWILNLLGIFIVQKSLMTQITHQKGQQRTHTRLN